MRNHVNKTKPKKSILNKAVANALKLPRNLDHIQIDHNQPTPSTSRDINQNVLTFNLKEFL